jgi:succinoglycan biosynthesis transport protein ExoP
MQNYMPQLEMIPSRNHGFVDRDASPWYLAPRAQVFMLVFLVIAAIGLVYTFVQPSVFQSRASVLMAALTAVDQSSGEADIQHLAIQRRILLGSELINSTQNLLMERGYAASIESELGKLLDVEPVEDTNLVEMVARGTDASFLPLVIDTWIEVYLAARAADITQSLGDTQNIISEEVSGLEEKIEMARDELAQFRADNNIVSAERAENEALSRLNGINNSLNKSLEDEVRAQSELEAIQDALSRGDTVVPDRDQQTQSQLELDLQQLKLQLAELDQRYTREYLARQPSLKVLPEQIKELEAEITRRSEAGGKVVLDEALREYAAAQRTVVNIRKQYEEHKLEVEAFTQIFLVHQSRVSDLEDLEALLRESRTRLVQLETSQVQRYPQVTVISSGSLAQRIGPNYLLNTALTFAVALFSAVFGVWLRTFLGHQKPDVPPITVTGVRVYPGDGMDELAYQQATNAALEKHTQALEDKPADESPDATDADLEQK